MVDKINHKSMIKGELATGFNITSMGTTPQDEKNIALDALDGDSSYTPRKDHFHHAEYKNAKKERQTQKKRKSWHHILLMINQLQREIEANFQDIENILNYIRQVCEDTLEIIDGLNLQIDEMTRNYEFVTGIFDQSGEQELDQETHNRHVQALLNRYAERTGKKLSGESNLRAILLAQMDYEQTITLPHLQHKLILASDLYDDTVNSIENIGGQYNALNGRYRKSNDVNENNVKCNDLEEISIDTDKLKTQAKSKYDELHNKLDHLQEDYSINTQTNEVKNSEVKSNAKPVSLNTFGI